MTRRVRAVGAGPTLLVAVVMLASGALLVRLNRGLWFFGDDWAFLLDRGSRPGGLGLLDPHNEHWSTIPVLIYRSLYAVFGLAHYLPYVLPVIFAHLSVVALMFVLLVRLGANRWVAAWVASVIAFLGSGAENMVWAFQVGFVGSVVFGLLAVLLYDTLRPSRVSVALVWAACILSLMCSGVGITMVVLVAAFALGRHGLRAALVVMSLPAFVYVAWYAGWGRAAVRPQPPERLDYLKVPEYVWTGVLTTWERNIGVAAAGAVAAAVLVGACLALRGTRLALLARAGVLAALIQLLLSGVSRIGFGVEQATASRYSYLVSVLMLPAAALLLTAVVGRWRRDDWVPAAVMTVMAALVVVQGIRLEISFTQDRRTVVGDLPQRVAAGVALVERDAKLLGHVLEPKYNPNITSEALADPRVRRDMAAVPVTEQGLVEASGGLQVAVATSPLDVPLDGSASIVASGEKLTAGCGSYAGQPTLAVLVDARAGGGQLRVVTPGTEIQTRLHHGSFVSAARTFPVTPGVPLFVGTSSGDALEIIVTGAASATLCN